MTNLAQRLGWMADAAISAKVGPSARFFSRERVDEIVLLLREAEKAILNLEQELRVASVLSVAEPRPDALDALIAEMRHHELVSGQYAAEFADENLLPDPGGRGMADREAARWRSMADRLAALRSVLAQKPIQRIDIEAMRLNLHATFNGGWEDPPTRRAFHHGMDTVCNVLESYQRGESTNGILPAGGSPEPDPLEESQS